MKVAAYEYSDEADFLRNLFANRIVKEIRISAQILLDLTGLKSLDDVVDESVAHDHPWLNSIDITFRKSDLARGEVATLYGTPVTSDAFLITALEKLPGRSMLVFYEERT